MRGIYNHKMTDRRTTFSRLKEMLKDYRPRRNSKTSEISFATLEKLIVMNIGSNQRTIADSMRTMVLTGLLQDIGDGRFRIVRMNLE